MGLKKDGGRDGSRSAGGGGEREQGKKKVNKKGEGLVLRCGWTDGMWGGRGDRSVLSGGGEITRIAEVEWDERYLSFCFFFFFNPFLAGFVTSCDCHDKLVNKTPSIFEGLTSNATGAVLWK